ncbi:unnamed protein product [Spirodela intermedia]|uniref:Uncharacterized protein n=1 Tax=Spirodela intermedia TaxID=51605 RepID=A0A7I8JHQ8_SPIIN|nr:unnamed protein product [Spirodela intermedia]CAA6669285.1 unnamed protein product [Spirodela intermedia]
MGNSVRCCLACVLPCGTLDVVRVVHLGGRVEEFSRRVTAGEVLRGNPGHVLSNPCSQGVLRRTLVSSPRSELRRGSIYFLIPEASLRQERRSKAMGRTHRRKASRRPRAPRKLFRRRLPWRVRPMQLAAVEFRRRRRNPPWPEKVFRRWLTRRGSRLTGGTCGGRVWRASRRKRNRYFCRRMGL